MEAIVTVKIPEDVTLMVERTMYEMSALSTMITTFTLSTEFPIDNDKYTILLDKYVLAYTETAITLAKIFSTYLDPQYLSDLYYDKEVYPEFNEIHVYRKDTEHGTCSCRTKGSCCG